MSNRVSREDYPWWVKVGIWGLSSRNGLWLFVVISLAAASFCICSYALSGFPRWYLGPLFLLAALMYWLSIRWIDRNGSWEL